MIEGTCHCGAVRWKLSEIPESATACNCTSCRRYAALWAYGFEGENITVSGTTTAYVHADSLSFNFCPTCGNLGYWRSLQLNKQGQRRMAVNLRLTEPGSIENVPIVRFDGLDTWQRLPGDEKCIKDLWF